MITLAIDIFIVLIVLGCCILSWKVYRLTRAKSMVVIFIAMCFAVPVRIGVILKFPYAPEMALALWVLWAIGLCNLLKTLKRYIGRRG